MGDNPVSAEALKSFKGKKVETKEGGGQDPAFTAFLEKTYTDNGGDMGKISAALDSKFKDSFKPTSAGDFAAQYNYNVLD
jgi:hypothetical protein